MDQQTEYTLVTTESGQQILTQSITNGNMTGSISVEVDGDPVASEVILPITREEFLDLQEKTKTNTIDFDTINQEVTTTPKTMEPETTETEESKA